MPEIPWLVVKNLVIVGFRATATQADRQAAVDLVEGEVVGGDATGGAASGQYFVVLPEDRTGRRMLSALEALRRLPQVAYAAFDQANQGF